MEQHPDIDLMQGPWQQAKYFAHIISIFIGILWGGDCRYSSPVYIRGRWSNSAKIREHSARNGKPEHTMLLSVLASAVLPPGNRRLCVRVWLFPRKHLTTSWHHQFIILKRNKLEDCLWWEPSEDSQLAESELKLTGIVPPSTFQRHCPNRNFLTHLPTRSWTAPDLLQGMPGPF